MATTYQMSAHSFANFSVKHILIAKVYGNENKYFEYRDCKDDRGFGYSWKIYEPEPNRRRK